MRLTFDLKGKFKLLCFILIFLGVVIFQTNFQIVKAFSMENYLRGTVVEELRLMVPSEFKEVWLKAEKEVWEPWLSIQDGFIGRQIFFDKEKEEALILVSWKNKRLWKSISMNEVNAIQESFEENVKTALNINVNPFNLIYEGELIQER